MKCLLSALFTLAVVPAIFAEDQKPSSLWEVIGDKLDHGVGPSPYIAGGVEAAPHSYPHQAMLYITPRSAVVAFCAGSLISPDWVLTAGHCVSIAKIVAVILGAHNMISPSPETVQGIQVSEIHIEPNYVTQDTDIALLKLEKPANINQFVQPIRLPALSMSGKELGGTPAEIIGWGRYTDPDSGRSPVLRVARTKVLLQANCRKAWGASIKDWRICSDGSNKAGPCAGDSGGPMIITEGDGQRSVIGIVSFGNGAGCVTGSPAVFTRVDHWLDWINKLTKIPLRN